MNFHEMNIEMDNQYCEFVKENKTPSFFICDHNSFMTYFMGLREFFGGNGPIFGIPEKIDLCFPNAVDIKLYPIKDERTFVRAVVL